MNAQIISIGTELLLGQVVNTNATFIAKELAALGINLYEVTTVGDNPARLFRAVENALSENDLVITTGGLGPTTDDLSKEAVAKALGVGLSFDAATFERIKEYFGTRPMDETQRRQAYLPEGAEALPNDVGTAPGIYMEKGEKTLVMLPGPPRELVPMFLNSVAPLLAQKSGFRLVSKMVRTFNQSEGAGALLIDDLCQNANPSVATYIDGANEMYVRVSARGNSKEEARALVEPVALEVARRLGDVVYGFDDDTLEGAVVKLLAKRGEELATAESCTGGLLAKRITDVAGASGVFKTGVVSYANETKTRLLGVPESTLAEHGAVSEEVARLMASGVRKLYGADYGIGITGIAGPGGATPEKPLGLVWISLSDKNGCIAKKIELKGRYPGREATRQKSASFALDLLRRRLEGKI